MHLILQEFQLTRLLMCQKEISHAETSLRIRIVIFINTDLVLSIDFIIFILFI